MVEASDENKVLWRMLELQIQSWRKMSEVIKQFDEKSGASLEEFSLWSSIILINLNNYLN